MQKKQWFVFDSIADLITYKVNEVWWNIILFDAYDILKSQVEADLLPVVHNAENFAFDETFEFVKKFAK